MRSPCAQATVPASSRRTGTVVPRRTKPMKRRVIVTAALLLCLAGAWAERPGDFRVIGPGGGGAMFNPTISPHDASTVLVSCDMSGSYITHDGGQTWRMFNLRGVVNFFAFDPSDPKTIYAHATGLWRSVDGGENWNLVSPSPASVQGVKMSSDHADEIILAQADPVGEIVAMAIDPANSRVLYVAGGSKEKRVLFVSRDFGQTWLRQADLPVDVRRMWVDTHSSAETRSLFLAGTQSLMVVNGASVQNVRLPAPATDISLGLGSGSQPTI